MRNLRTDRRTAAELQNLIERKIRVTLTSWEKRNLKEEYQKTFNSKIQENCGSCWYKAIKQLAEKNPNQKIKPLLVKAKMIVHDKDEVKLVGIDEVQIVEGKTKEELMVIACELAEAKEIKKPHPRTGVEKLEIFIKDNS